MMTSTNVDVTTGQVHKALGDPLRRRIVELLAGEQLCTCHLVEETGAGQTTVSNALRVLRESELVESEPCGRFTYHRLRPQVLHTLAAELTRVATSAEAAHGVRRPC